MASLPPPASSPLPPTLDTLYTSSSSSTQSPSDYDSIHLTDSQILTVLQLPLAQRIFGRSSQSSSSSSDQHSQDQIQQLSSAYLRGDITYNQLIQQNITAVLSQTSTNTNTNNDDDAAAAAATENITRSQLLHIAYAALLAFIQASATGPPLTFRPGDVVLPPSGLLDESGSGYEKLRDGMIRELTVDGEAIAYRLVAGVELFCAVGGILAALSSSSGSGSPGINEEDGDEDGLTDGRKEPVMLRTVRLRYNFLHQKMLSENTDTLQAEIYKDLGVIRKCVLGHVGAHTDANEDAEVVREKKVRFLLERATIHTHHGQDAAARADLEHAARLNGFEYALTGRLGKRTKWQERDVSQLVVLAKSRKGVETRNEKAGEDERTENGTARPKKLDLNDDTLLEAISFTPAAQEGESRAMTVQDESSLPPALAGLDPSNQPKLNPLDSIVLLALASAITNTNPEDGLTREETLPYATRVLEGGSSNWQVYTQALLVRSRVEGYKSRTVERGVLQLQAIVDQVIADTASDVSAAANAKEQQQQHQPSTFLPRPENSESAPASERLEYIWLLNFSTRWDLEAELASRWVSLGALRTALEIYERLQMWAEAALCNAATDREDKARLIVRRQLFQPSQPGREYDENEQFTGPERSPLPVDAPRLFCILGDIDKNYHLYERAWVVSNQRYARAQRALARYYLGLKPPQFHKAEQAYLLSLKINRLNHAAWFSLGCIQLELRKWADAVRSFTRAVQLEDGDAESWSNLAAALVNVPPPEPKKVEKTVTADDEEEEADEREGVETVDIYKPKRDALAALHRAARLKHTDYRIWSNILSIGASIPPPTTPFRDILHAQKRIIELRAAKDGEKCIDLPFLTAIINTLTADYDFNEPDPHPIITNPNGIKTARRGTVPALIMSLVDEDITPLITHSAPLWLLVARLEKWRGRPGRALAAHEKAWRATVAARASAAFQMADERAWMEVVRATEGLVRDGYAGLGGVKREVDEQKEIEGKGEGGTEGGEMVAKDWRFKARSAVRGILGKGKDVWEGSEGWLRLKGLAEEVSGSA